MQLQSTQNSLADRYAVNVVRSGEVKSYQVIDMHSGGTVVASYSSLNQCSIECAYLSLLNRRQVRQASLASLAGRERPSGE